VVAPLTRERVLVARVSVSVAAAGDRVWAVLLDPTRYMPVADVAADWREGGAIRWKADLNGKHLDVQALIEWLDAPRVMEYRYINPLSRAAHHVTIELSDEDGGTRISLTEDGHATERELAHAEGGWRLMLHNVKSQLERDGA
jgi:hypothetical protein